MNLFVFVAFVWRLGSVLYIDLLGPLYSEQLNSNIGPGIAAVPIAVSQALVIAALLFSFRHSRLFKSAMTRPWSSLSLSWKKFSLSDFSFWLSSVFLLALFVELVARGPIPLFAGIERYDYTREYGGLLHHVLLKWEPMLTFQFGVFFTAPAFRGRPLDRRFGFLLVITLAYLFLVGHRFSAFYDSISFFLVPIGVLYLARDLVHPGWNFVSRSSVARFWLAGAVISVLILAAVFHSYTVVRGFSGSELFSKLSQRIFVQQGEMWWPTYERVFLHGNWNRFDTLTRLLVNPFDPTRNSTMQLLMERDLPLDRAHDILRYGSSYTGGWPEVFFEIGGPIGGFVLVVVGAILFSEFMFLLMRCILEERLITCFFLTPVLYAVLLVIVSGMINSFVQTTFLIKLVLALVAYIAEDRWRAARLLSAPSQGERIQ
ncbi:MAG: hypothetical protein KGR71_09675 [Proteobacteria bacterium]|nr:hypothetical protein [Pseudomonadota bacterium]